MKALGLVGSDKIFESCILKTFFYPVTYLCNPSEPFEHFFKGTTQGPFLLSLVTFPLAVQEKMSFELFLTQFNVKLWPRGGVNFNPRGIIWTTLERTSRWCYIPNMKALGLVVSDKKIFENCILKNYFLTPWPTNATNQNHLNNFGRGPLRDHSCRVWSNYH